MIPFTVQPTNFQHVQICPLCNHADDLATSGRRLHQSLGAEWSRVFFLFRLINVKKTKQTPDCVLSLPMRYQSLVDV